MDNSQLNDGLNFTGKANLPLLLSAFGWICKDFMVCDNLAPLKADFYPKGFVLALSKKAVILCDGESLIRYDGEEFESFADLKFKYGRNAYRTFPDWEIVVEKEWVVKKNGEWLYAFTNFSELPFRSNMKQLTGEMC